MLGERLADARRRKGMTLTDLAVALGDRYDHSVLSRVEGNKSSLRLDGLVRAAQELGVSTDYLLGLTDDPTPSSQRVPLDAGPEVGHVYVEAQSPADTVLVPQVAGIPAGNQGSVSPSETEGFPIPRAFLTKHGIDARRAGIIEVQGQSMYPALPHGSMVLVDFARRWLRHNLIYLINIITGANNMTYEVRRLRGETQRQFQWNADFYLDFEDGGPSWPVESWRRELWFDEVRGNILRRRDLSDNAPFPHGEGNDNNDYRVVVLGQVRGLLHMFDDEGW